MIRVVVADDERLVREGVCTLLSLRPEVTLVGAVDSGDALLELLATTPADVALVDIRMPRMDGLRATRALRERACSAPVILLTTFHDRTLVIEALRAGAAGYLRKDIEVGELVRAVAAVAEGGTYFQPSITATLLDSLAATQALTVERSVVGTPERLTARETEVMRLVAAGLSNREIAEALTTTVGTVKTQVSSILGKLGARDRLQALVTALEQRLL